MLTATDLINLLAAVPQPALACESSFSNYFVWTPLTLDFSEELVWVGTTASEQHSREHGYTEYPSLYNYWSPDFPIVLAFYPYNDCQVYQHQSSGCYFFVYTEYGGHAPERRCRLIRESLIIPESQ